MRYLNTGGAGGLGSKPKLTHWRIIGQKRTPIAVGAAKYLTPKMA